MLLWDLILIKLPVSPHLYTLMLIFDCLLRKHNNQCQIEFDPNFLMQPSRIIFENTLSRFPPSPYLLLLSCHLQIAFFESDFSFSSELLVYGKMQYFCLQVSTNLSEPSITSNIHLSQFQNLTEF